MLRTRVIGFDAHYSWRVQDACSSSEGNNASVQPCTLIHASQPTRVTYHRHSTIRWLNLTRAHPTAYGLVYRSERFPIILDK